MKKTKGRPLKKPISKRTSRTNQKKEKEIVSALSAMQMRKQRKQTQEPTLAEIALKLTRKVLHGLEYGKKTKKAMSESFLKHLQQKKHKNNSQDPSSQFNCPICLDILFTPCLTVCGHVFCFQCLEEHFLRQSNCPSCRLFIRGHEYRVSQQTVNIVNKYFQKNQSEEIKEKMEQSEKWVRQRWLKIDKVKENEQIDCRDTEFIWCRARIHKIIRDQQNRIQEFLIHYDGWNTIYDQVISYDSIRLAPFGFFTSRSDIPKYTLTMEQNNIRSRIQYPQERQNQIFQAEFPHAGFLNINFIRQRNFSNRNQVIEIQSSNSQRDQSNEEDEEEEGQSSSIQQISSLQSLHSFLSQEYIDDDPQLQDESGEMPQLPDLQINLRSSNQQQNQNHMLNQRQAGQSQNESQVQSPEPQYPIQIQRQDDNLDRIQIQIDIIDQNSDNDGSIQGLVIRNQTNQHQQIDEQ